MLWSGPYRYIALFNAINLWPLKECLINNLFEGLSRELVHV